MDRTRWRAKFRTALRRLTALVVGVVVGAGIMVSAAAQPQNEATDGAIYLTADHLVDVRNGVRVPAAAIVIRDGVIEAVGTSATLPVPSGARVMTMPPGMTLMPGLIDMHVHITGNPQRGDRSRPEQFEVIHGLVNAKKTLLAGFTTIRNVGSSRYTDVALRDAINDGLIEGPRMFVSGPPVGIIGGHCSDDTYSPPEDESFGENIATGPWEMRAQVRKNIKYGVDLIKTCSTGGVFSRGTLLGAPQGTVDELKAIADEAHMRGLKVAAHAHGTIGIKNALKAGIDTIEHASFLDDEAIRMAKKSGAFLSMDIYNTEYTLSKGAENGVSEESLNKEREVGTIQRESFTKAVKAGAKVILGTDAAIFPHGDNAKQLSRMVQFGMTPAQALRAATSLAAEALGRDADLGQLAPGFRADIIAVKGDPLTDVSVLETVEFVMKDGVVYKAP
ncbi:MAG: amidohydrolase family protein [Pseudomonadota bacterium]